MTWGEEEVTVRVRDLAEVILLWRASQEAPGGISALQAVQDMTRFIWRLEHAIRAQHGRSSEGVGITRRAQR